MKLEYLKKEHFGWWSGDLIVWDKDVLKALCFGEIYPDTGTGYRYVLNIRFNSTVRSEVLGSELIMKRVCWGVMGRPASNSTRLIAPQNQVLAWLKEGVLEAVHDLGRYEQDLYWRDDPYWVQNRDNILNMFKTKV